MRAFLSHSSKDKGFVEAVADSLRPGTYELDSLTFDAGLLNSQAIIAALSRSNLFCLFLSKNSINSSYVEFEILLGIEFLAKAGISQFLAICIDDEAFSRASANVKFFSIVRNVGTPESTARLIQGHLLTSMSSGNERNHPFVGREDEIKELEYQISDHARPHIRGLFISGNAGAGRRTLARKFYEAQFPHVGKVLPQIEIEAFDGLEELHRTVLMKLRPTIRPTDLAVRIKAFGIAKPDERRTQIAQLLNSLLTAKEAAILLDNGGLLTDSGKLNPEINEVVARLEARPHPPVIFISPRMIPKSLRRPENDVAYSAIQILKRDTTVRLIGKLLKEKSITITDEQLQDLTNLSECHPYNIYRLVDDIRELGVTAFLANPAEFNNWKHRQSSEYLNKVNLDESDRLILGVLKIIPQLDFEAIVSATKLSPSALSDALQRLTQLHIVNASENLFLVAPAIRIAVERDSRTRLQPDVQDLAIKSLATSLTIRVEAGFAPVSLINSAILSTIQSGETPSQFAAAFMLPSHYVWLCKYHYDQRNWAESMRYGQEALKGEARLSPNGFVAACRFVCLASARLGKEDIFSTAIGKLERSANDDWAKSNVAYLKGFLLRNQGNLPEAEKMFELASELSPGNLAALRELAAIALARGNLSKAETLSRAALVHAPSNAFLLDILISVLIKKHSQQMANISEINGLFAILEQADEESGRSFFTTRKAEFEHLSGNNRTALELIEQAIRKTPGLFEPRRLHTEILLKDGNKTKAAEVLQVMRQMVEAHRISDIRFNNRAYLETYSRYLVALGQMSEAKALFNDLRVFTDEERDKAIKEIEIIDSYRAKRG